MKPPFPREVLGLGEFKNYIEYQNFTKKYSKSYLYSLILFNFPILTYNIYGLELHNEFSEHPSLRHWHLDKANYIEIPYISDLNAIYICYARTIRYKEEKDSINNLYQEFKSNKNDYFKQSIIKQFRIK